MSSTVLAPGKPIDYEQLIECLLPFSHSAYWFLTDYILLMILSPFLNRLIKSLTKEKFLGLLILVLVIWSIIPTFIGIKSFDINDLIWFIVLYLIGSFIRLHIDIPKLKMKKLLLALFASLTILFVVSCIANIYTNFELVKPLYKTLFHENNILMIFSSILILLIFLRRKSFSNRYINYISGSVLGIYMIHDNILLRKYIWEGIFHVSSYYNSNNFLIVMMVIIITVFASCIIIDVLRRLTVEKVWILVVDKIDLKLSAWLNNKTKRLESKMDYYLK